MFQTASERDDWIHQLCLDEEKYCRYKDCRTLSVLDPITKRRVNLTDNRIQEYLRGEGDFGIGQHPKWEVDEQSTIQSLLREERKANQVEVNDPFQYSYRTTLYDWINGCYITLTRERAVEFLDLKETHLADKEIFRLLEEAEAFATPDSNDKLVEYPKGGGRIGVVRQSVFTKISPEYAIWRRNQRQQYYHRKAMEDMIDQFEKAGYLKIPNKL